jgi:hypothetical protein
MAQRLEWIEYLLIDVENEKNPNIQKFYPAIKAIVDGVKSKKISNENGALCINSMIPCILELTEEKYRINNLFKAIVSYTKKIN